MLPSSVDSRGLLGPSPPGNAFLASSVSCFIWRQVSFMLIKIALLATVCIQQLFNYSANSIQPPTFQIQWIVTFSSSFLARPACAIFFWCGLPARWDSKVFKKTELKYRVIYFTGTVKVFELKNHTFWQETVSLHTSHFIGTAWNGKSEHRNNAAFILLFSFGTSSTFVVAPWLFKRHTWVVWSFR